MTTIHTIRLAFQAGNEEFVRELYGRWDTFCRMGVEETTDRILSRYDSENEVIRIENLVVEVGNIPEDVFYERFPEMMGRKLEEVFTGLLRHREAYPVEIVSLHRDSLQALLYFLLRGYLPGNVPEEYRDLKRLLRLVIREKGYELGTGLRKLGEKEGMRRRLVKQFDDRELEMTVNMTEPSEALFINVYTRSLLFSWPRLKRPEITSGDYRNVVWEVVWAYLLCEGRSFFSRKELVKQTLTGLAQHFNLKFFYLLSLLTDGLKRMMTGWLIMPELSVILSEIREEETGKMQKGEMEELTLGEEEIRSRNAAMWRKLLARPDSCRRLLSPMREEEIYRLVEMVIPSESPFVISYAQVLDREKERGRLEGKAGPEFRILKWEFLFTVLLSFPVSSFQRKRFVWMVIRRIAVHYNLDSRTLLIYLCSEPEGLPEILKIVLQDLYEEQMADLPLRLAEAVAYRTLLAVEKERLKYTLLHPRMAHRLLCALPEAGIYRLTRILVPAESTFVISYARALDREERKGMLEGRGGEEFRVLKWEFIFIVILSAPVFGLSRKQFVYSVLRQMAAHYNLTTIGLLNYFFEALDMRKTDFSPGLSEIFLELRREIVRDIEIPEDKKGKKSLAEMSDREIAGLLEKSKTRPEYRRGLFRALCDCRRVTQPLLKKVGEDFMVEILKAYRQPGINVFLRLHRQVVWRYIVSSVSVEGLKELYCRIQLEEGFLNFLLEIFGEKPLTEVFRKADIRLPQPERLLESVWQEALDRKDSERISGMLEESPAFLRRRMKVLTREEKERLEELFITCPFLLEKWTVVVGSPALRQAMEEIRQFLVRMNIKSEKGCWVGGFLPWIYAEDLSKEEILYFFLVRIMKKWEVEQKRKGYETVRKYFRQLPGWLKIMEKIGGMKEIVKDAEERKFEKYEKSGKPGEGCWEEEKKINTKGMWNKNKLEEAENKEGKKLVLSGNKKEEEFVELKTEKNMKSDQEITAWELTEGYRIEPEDKGELQEEKRMKTKRRKSFFLKEEERFYISNAGAVILSPYLPLLFERLKWTTEGAFLDIEAQIRAVFAVQYLVFGQVEFPESELILNKLLVGWRSEEPLPFSVNFTKEEKSILDSLLKGAKENWEMMRHTSVTGFRGSFLIRNGVVAETGDLWQLTVEKKSYDVLLDALPWNISPVKYPWMEKVLYVNWR